MKNYRTPRLLAILAIPLFLASCKEDKPEIPVSCTGVEWSHFGQEDGQDDWLNLCEGNSACGGTTQSPINITGAVDNPMLDSLFFVYGKTPVEIENKGYTVEFVCEPGSVLVIGSTEYVLKQFHYHTTSEHQLNGASFPLEVHFVHKASDTDLAVVGVFFEAGAENELFAKYLSKFPTSEGEYKDATQEIELASLLPANRSFYNYGGSLTTPPCSEVVRWFVLKEKITASAAQIAQFQSILDNNHRQVQPLNGRVVYSHEQ